MILVPVVQGKSISAVVALEIPSLAPNESKLSLVGSLRILKNVAVNKDKKKDPHAVSLLFEDARVAYLVSASARAWKMSLVCSSKILPVFDS